MNPHPPTSDHAIGPALARLNAMPVAEATATFHTVCGSKRWAEHMAGTRPFRSVESLLGEAERCWLSLGREDWLEAFGHHPRIGERNLSQPKFAATATQSSREQSGMAAATDEQKREFAAGNEQYERTFGHVFLICATGKTANEMLASLRSRLGNDPATELSNAAKEQAKIIRIRLERWLST